MPYPITYRSLFFLREGVDFHRDRVDIIELEGRLNDGTTKGIAEAAYVADRQLSDSFHGGGSTRPIVDDHIRIAPRASTAILIHASAQQGFAGDAELARQGWLLDVADIISIEPENDGQWRTRWIAPEVR
jgi:hypothetical protein